MSDADLQIIAQKVLDEALRRTPMNQYVIWTGIAASGRASSLRARAFACVREVGTPVSLRMLMQRAARIDGLRGLNPDSVRSAVRQHQIARPAVLFLVEKAPSGDFVAVADIPFAGAVDRRLRAGDVVVDRTGVFRLSTLATAA
jgi:hypothetical protein